MKAIFGLLKTYITRMLPGMLLEALSVFGVMLPLCRAFSIPASVGMLALYAILFCGFFSLFTANSRLFAAGFIAFIAAAAAGIYVQRDVWAQCLFALMNLRGETLLNALVIHSGTIVPALCFLLARLLSTSVSTEDTTYAAPVSHYFLLLVVVMLLLICTPQLHALYLLPLLLAFLIAMCRASAHPFSWGRLIPTASLCLLIAALLTPIQFSANPTLSSLMQRTRQFIEDHFFFTQSRTVYSLYMSGYQPYGHERLGGPISPTDDPVMEVTTPENALLRGVIHNDYTGFYWRNTLPSNRYLFVDPRFQGLRKEIFNLNLPAESLRTQSDAFAPKTLEIRLLKDCFSTLFVPARTQTLTSASGLVPYFSPASEIFATRDLAPEDTYALYAPLVHADMPQIDSLIHAAQQNPDPAYDEMMAQYTAVPDTVEAAVYQLTYAVIQDAQTPFEKAQMLCTFLRTRYPYTYDQNVPPTDRDFVSWFLLDEKQGYCVSYASAMAIMGRIAGLPTRYVEGYVARPDEDGIARVTELNAHAWVEVYFSGFGWVPFDPTAGSVFASDESHDSQDTPAQAPDTPPESTPTPPPDAPDQENGASQLPTPEPTPTPEPDTENTPPPPESQDAPTPTPPEAPIATPTPTPPLTPPDQPDSPDDPDDPDDDFAPPLPLLLLLLLLVATVAARLYTTQPTFVAARTQDQRLQLLVYYRAVLCALACMRLSRFADETPVSHAVRVWHTLDGKDVRDATGIVRAAKSISASQYSPHGPQKGDVEFLHTVYLRLFKRMTPMQKLLLFVRRIFKGLGDLKRI